jgi:TPR repeat protein
MQDYKQAINWYRLAAEQEHVLAQSNLGFMYEKGQGVAQNYKEAMTWYRLAAEKNNALAQYNLGVMYAYGQGASQDYAHAYVWFNLSTTNGYVPALELRETALSQLSPDQIEKAQKMSRECLNSNFKNCD